jgi:all-trans-retinol 13,14-reductase
LKLTDSYKQNPQIDDKYDAIFIGSGLGSLTAAVILAKQGQKVLVLEKHYTPGGFTHVFSRTDYEWDVGLHYVGDVHKKGTFFNLTFDYLTDGKLKWEDMGDVYDRVFFGNKEYPLKKGVKEFKQMLKNEFPGEEAAIDKYVQLLFEVNAANRTFYMEKVMPNFIRKIASGWMRGKLTKYSSKTTYDTIKELTNNEELIGVLSAQFGDYGMPPKQSSFAIHGVVARHYLNGGAYPIGGSAEIFKTMAPLITKRGGNTLTNADVKEVIIENNKAIGVLMADGKKIYGDKIISGTGLINTLHHLLPKPIAEKMPLYKELKTVPPSTSHLCLYIGIKESADKLNLPKANYWIYPNNYDHDVNLENFLKDPDNADFPVVYISFPSAKDPDWENRYPNTSTIEIITVAPYEWFKKWENTRWKKRGEEYEAYKEKMSQRLLEALFEKEPQLRSKIDYYELSTPLSTKKFANYQTGEIYGLDHTPERYAMKHLTPATPVKNFYLTGQDVVSVGIGGAVMSGLLTASAILKKNLINDIVKK